MEGNEAKLDSAENGSLWADQALSFAESPIEQLFASQCLKSDKYFLK